MKVLHVITRLDRGGSARAVLNLAEGLKRRGFDVVLVTGLSKEPEEEVDSFNKRTGIPCYIIPGLVRDISPLKDLSTLLRLVRILRIEMPDILHTHTSKAGFLGRLAGRIARIRHIVHTTHGHIFYGYFGRLKTWFFIQLERIAAHLCDRIIVLTSLEKDDYVRAGIGRADTILPIYPGIDLNQYFKKKSKDTDIKKELSIEKDSPLIGWVGRLEGIKGCFDFLKAARLVLDRYPGSYFLMAGDGPLRTDLNDWIVKNSMDGRVLLLGYRRDVVRIMNGIDVFVLTSHNEGLGLVVVEAMAAGKPVVATDVGGVSEVVVDGQTGILLPAGEPLRMAEAILRLISDPALASRLGGAGRERASLFSIDTMIDRTIELYNDIAA